MGLSSNFNNNYDTLWLKGSSASTQATDWPWANLELENLTAHGNITIYGALTVGSNQSLTDAYGQSSTSCKGYFLQSDPTNGYPKWVSQSATWNGGTVTTNIEINCVQPYLDLLYAGYEEWEIGMITSGSTSLQFAYSNHNVVMTLDYSGDLTLAGALSTTATNFHLAPISGGNIGFTNYAKSQWGLYVTDATNPTAHTMNNTLDDGSGNMRFAGTLSLGGTQSNIAYSDGLTASGLWNIGGNWFTNYDASFFQDMFKFNPPMLAEYQDSGGWHSTSIPLTLFLGEQLGGFNIANGWLGYRLTWNNNMYSFLEALLIHYSTQGNSMTMTLQTSTDNTNWTTVTTISGINSWPGYTAYKKGIMTYSPNIYIRIIFTPAWNNGNGIELYNIRYMASYPYNWTNENFALYTWDAYKNVTFGNAITSGGDVIIPGSNHLYFNGGTTCLNYYSGYGNNTITTSADFNVNGNLYMAGQISFYPGSGKYAYLIWSNSYVLTLGANGGPFYYGVGHDGYTGYFGALDCGAVFTQYINPIGSLSTVTLGGNFTVNGNIYSWNGGGGGGSNGGIYLDSYGNVRFGGGSGTGDHNWVTYFGNTILMQVWNNGYLSLPQTLNGSNVPVYCNSSGTLYKSSSSIRYKERIQPVTDSSWIYTLKPVTFYWKQEEQALRGINQQIGLIAEDVNTVQPLLTYMDTQGNIDGVYYEKLAVPIVVELQKLRARVDQLESQLKQKPAAAA